MAHQGGGGGLQSPTRARDGWFPSTTQACREHAILFTSKLSCVLFNVPPNVHLVDIVNVELESMMLRFPEPTNSQTAITAQT